MRKPARFLAILCTGLASVGFFFRYQLFNGFNVLNGDRYDGVIETSILEHWYNVLQGHAHWATTNYFFPAPLTLGYNDGYLLFGLIYSGFRFWGLDPFLSSELVNVTIRSVGFISFYLMARDIGGLSVVWSLFAAALFTIANNLFIHAHHAQLFSVCFVPVLALLLYEFMTAFWQESRLCVVGWGIAAAALFGAWLLTAYYTAWFFVFFSTALAPMYALTSRTTHLRAIVEHVKSQISALTIVAVAGAVFIAPFLWLYLPKANETGMHPYSVVVYFAPTLLDVVSVGEANVVWGRVVAFINRSLGPGGFAVAEGRTGVPLGLLVTFLAGVTALWLAHRKSNVDRPPMILAIALATLLSWILCIRVGPRTGWWAVYTLFPGAKAVRAVTRYQLFLFAPVVLVAVWQLSRLKFGGAAMSIALCAFLLLEEASTPVALGLNRPREVARLKDIGAPPAECKSFFASSPRKGLYGPEIDAKYSHNVDAMIVAETTNTPTINGFASFAPPGWDLFAPEAPDYRARVAAYADANGVRGLCELNLRTPAWDSNPEVLAR